MNPLPILLELFCVGVIVRLCYQVMNGLQSGVVKTRAGQSIDRETNELLYWIQIGWKVIGIVLVSLFIVYTYQSTKSKY